MEEVVVAVAADADDDDAWLVDLVTGYDIMAVTDASWSWPKSSSACSTRILSFDCGR